MGRVDKIYRLLYYKPRLTTRQIADILELQITNVSVTLHKMINIGYIKAKTPTRKEMDHIINIYPNSINGIKLIKVFEINPKY